MTEDHATLYRHSADALIQAVDAHLDEWLFALVANRLRDWNGGVDRENTTAECIADIHRLTLSELSALVGQDVADQRTTPLHIVRRNLAPLTRLLEDAGVPVPRRDPLRVEMSPQDYYDVEPARFDEIHPDLGAVALTWGAAKAMLILDRRRPT